MKKRWIQFAFTFVCVVIAATYSTTIRVSAQSLPQSQEATERDGDDPQARDQWEWMRLHDPATGQIPPRMRDKELSFARTLPKRDELARTGFIKGQRTMEAAPSAWTHRGPWNVGGRTRALAVDQSNTGLILAGGISGGMWRSTDTGATWSRTTSPFDSIQSVTCIAQDKRAGHTSTWYYGTGEYTGNSATGGGFASYEGDGISKSTDGGLTWVVLPSTKTGTPNYFTDAFNYIWDLAIDPSNMAQAVVYAATYGGIQRSSDGGNSWTSVIGATSGLTSPWTDIAVTSTGVGYAVLSQSTSGGGTSAYKGIYRSTDGITWTNITPATWPATYRRFVLTIAPSNEHVVYFLGETPGSGFHTVYNGSDSWTSFWKYTDNDSGTGTWENRSANLPGYGGLSGDIASQGSYDLVVRTKPDDENVVIIGGTDLFRSTSGFADNTHTTWIGGYHLTGTYDPYPNHHPDQHSIAFSPANSSVMYNGNDGGVFRTSDDLAASIVWTPLNNGYTTSQFYTVAIDHATSGNNVVIGGTQDNGTWFTSTVSSTNAWPQLYSGDGAACAIADGRSSYYVSSQNGRMYRQLVDNSGNVTAQTRIDPTGGANYQFINQFILDPNNTNRMFLAGGTIVWRNNDLTGIPMGSNSTTSVNWDTLGNTRINAGVISSLGISTAPLGEILYYGTSAGRVYRLTGASLGNPVPTDITGASFPHLSYVSCIAVDPSNGSNVLGVFSNYNVVSLFYSTDAGSSWTNISGNLEEFASGFGRGPSCRWASILPIDGLTMYLVGTSTGLYSTFELNGTSTVWTQEGSSTIGDDVVDMIDSRYSDGLIVAATHANGIFSSNVAGLGSGTGSPENGVYEAPPNNGWILANKVTAPSQNVLITSLDYYYLGDASAGNGTFFPVIYATGGSPGRPAATPLYTGAAFTPTVGWNSIDVSAANIALNTTPSADFFVGVKYDGTHEPVIGNDSVSNGRGWEYDPTAPSWTPLDSLAPAIPATLFIRATVSTLTGVRTVGGSLPRVFSLEQNYPNPFNPEATIEFALPHPAVVTLRVFDALGREISTLVNREHYSAGRYSAKFNGANLTSGVYFYQITASESGPDGQTYDRVKKMLLIR